MEERLWEYIDGNCNAEEKMVVSRLLHTHPDWKSKYDELISLHTLIHASDLEAPSMRFTRNVMEEITKFHIAPAAKSYINKKVIYGIGGFYITMILGLLIYSLVQINWSAENNSVVDFSSFSFSRIINNTYFNIFMMINVVLALMLLDKYLGRKKEAFLNKKA